MDGLRIKLNDCPKCGSRKIYINEAVNWPFLNIKRFYAYVYCDQCKCRGKKGSTNTAAVAYWNDGILEEEEQNGNV